MSLFVALAITAGIILFISLVLAIINLVQLSNISNKIAYLDTEIEKKSIEFDAIKKDNVTNNPYGTNQIEQPQESFVQDTIKMESHHDSEFEIVRNLRDGYVEPQVQTNPASNATDVTVAGDVMDIVGDGNIDESQNNQPISNTIDISLYSEAINNTDFSGAWQMLINRLPQLPSPLVRISLKNILFLDQKELGYLQKFNETIQSYNGTLQLLDCTRELRQIIQKINTLENLII